LQIEDCRLQIVQTSPPFGLRPSIFHRRSSSFPNSCLGTHFPKLRFEPSCRGRPSRNRVSRKDVPKQEFGNERVEGEVSRFGRNRNGVSRKDVPKQEFGNERDRGGRAGFPLRAQ